MDKKRPKSLLVLSIIFILISIFRGAIGLFLCIKKALNPFIFLYGFSWSALSVDIQFWGLSFIYLSFSLISIGILHSKEWVRKLLIFLSSLIILFRLSVLILLINAERSFKWYRFPEFSQTRYILSYCYDIIPIIFFSYIIYYFTRKNIKELFNKNRKI